LTWDAYKNLEKNPNLQIPPSKHGMNWANVHKRLIPQIIRKGQIYADPELASKGMYFVVPDSVSRDSKQLLEIHLPFLILLTVYSACLPTLCPLRLNRVIRLAGRRTTLSRLLH